jgi:hypothetical protein
MKKILLIAFFAIGGFSAMAQQKTTRTQKKPLNTSLNAEKKAARAEEKLALEKALEKGQLPATPVNTTLAAEKMPAKENN